jgi:hypothetical protein
MMKIKINIPYTKSKFVGISLNIARQFKKNEQKPIELKDNKYNKIFCIGFNKTGTTTLEYTLKQHNFSVEKQSVFSNYANDWAARDFSRIIKSCKKADAFQDFPFSFPHTFIALDMAFPNSKFILTLRDNPEQWYNSIVKFHSKLWADGNVPTKQDLQNATRYYKGRPWQMNRMLFSSPEEDPYNKEKLIKQYLDHINNVKNYFRHREKDLLIINVSEKNSYKDFCNSLNISPIFDKFPWKNKT